MSRSSIEEKEFAERFGRKLQMIMKRENITQNELADAIGLNRPLISNYIRGKTIPSFYIVHRIARVLNCYTSELIGE